MKLRRDQLPQHLKHALLPIYWVAGDEPLLAQECLSSIRQAAVAKGFREREVIDIQKPEDWQALSEATMALSIFSNQRYLECRVRQGKAGEKGSKALMAFCQQMPEETIVVISSPKLDSGQARLKWFKTLEKIGAVIQVWPLNAREFQQWVQGQLRQRQLRATQAAIALLCERTEGHLLAAKQALDFLAIQYEAQHVLDVQDISQLVEQQSRFQSFQWVEAALAGEVMRTQTILQRLVAEGAEWALLLWVLTKEVRILMKVLWAQEQGEDVQLVYRQNGVWQSKQRLFNQAAKRLNRQRLHKVLQQAQVCDAALKGVNTLPIELVFKQLGMLLARCD